MHSVENGFCKTCISTLTLIQSPSKCSIFYNVIYENHLYILVLLAFVSTNLLTFKSQITMHRALSTHAPTQASRE